MQIPIDDVVVKKRIRGEIGDIGPLVDSMRRHGMLHPVAVNKKNQLVAGRRRLEAARALGWRTVPAVVVDARDELAKLELELEENVNRRELSDEEIAKATARIRKLRNPGFFRRVLAAIGRFLRALFRIQD